MPAPLGGPGARFLTDEEKANAPKLTKDLLVRILSYLKPYWLQFVLVFVAIVIAAVVGLVPSVVTGMIVDEALVGEDLRYLIQLLLIYFAGGLFYNREVRSDVDGRHCHRHGGAGKSTVPTG